MEFFLSWAWGKGMRRVALVVLSVFGMAWGGWAERPNIIVIMADDLGYGDLGFTGSEEIFTPHLDRLAAAGVVFEYGYANHPFCGPSRAAFLSGRYQHRFGFETNPAYDPANPIMGIDEGEVLFPLRLQKAGYTTALIGKWHLGAAEDFHPLNRGFDYFYGFLGGGHDYFRIDLTQPIKEGYLAGLERNKKPAGFEGYLTTALSDDAAQFIESQDGSDPFFLFLSYNAPHAPLQAPKEDIARYQHIADKKRRAYAAMIDVMDRGIGGVVAALQRKGFYENTLIFFLSDNGGPQANADGKGWNGSSNTPFRGGKGNVYDGGVHVPFMACWPARIQGGLRFDYPVQSLDIARTAVELAEADTSYGPLMEGVNLIPYVTGEKTGAPAPYLFWRGGSQWSVLAADRMKHLKDKDGERVELLHLPTDVSESNNLVDQQPERAEVMRAAWERWNQQNIPSRLMMYKHYHRDRDRFYEQAIPAQAREAGYVPEINRSF